MQFVAYTEEICFHKLDHDELKKPGIKHCLTYDSIYLKY